MDHQLDMFLALFRPLLTVDEAAYLLSDASADKIRSMLDEGALRGVDISSTWPGTLGVPQALSQSNGSKGANGERRELRVYRYSVEHHYLAPGKKLIKVPVERIFTHARPMFRRDEIAQLLNCTSRHVANLNLPGPKLSSAASAASAERTPRVYREGLVTFLTEREIG